MSETPGAGVGPPPFDPAIDAGERVLKSAQPGEAEPRQPIPVYTLPEEAVSSLPQKRLPPQQFAEGLKQARTETVRTDPLFTIDLFDVGAGLVLGFLIGYNVKSLIGFLTSKPAEAVAAIPK